MALPTDPGNIVLAIGGLGTASFALVDVASKTSPYGGLSNFGFKCIRSVVATLLTEATPPNLPPGNSPPPPQASTPAVSVQPASAAGSTVAPAAAPQQTHTVNHYTVLDQLHANWINGVALADQCKIAKAALKLELNANTVTSFALVAGINPADLLRVVQQLESNTPLTDAETATYGRLDFVLGTMIDSAYQRADQKYRNWARLWAGVCALVLAFVGGWAVSNSVFASFLGSRDMCLSLLGGLLAVPLAPVAKDLASTLAAAKNMVQSLREK